MAPVAAGAFAAAALMSATARADDASTILADITAEEGWTTTAFANSAADFAKGDSLDGLTQ